MTKENAKIMEGALREIQYACYNSDNCLQCPAFLAKFGCMIRDPNGDAPADWGWEQEANA